MSKFSWKTEIAFHSGLPRSIEPNRYIDNGCCGNTITQLYNIKPIYLFQCARRLFGTVLVV